MRSDAYKNGLKSFAAVSGRLKARDTLFLFLRLRLFVGNGRQ